MIDRIPAKFRYLAAIYYLLFAIVTGAITVNIISLAFRDNQGMNIFGLVSSFIILIATHFGMLFLSFFFWISTSKIHPFIQLAGRDVTSYTMNNALILTLILMIFPSLCGVYSASRLNFKFNPSDITINGMIAMMSFTNIVYSINSVVCGIFAIRGYHFENKFICPFTRGN